MPNLTRAALWLLIALAHPGCAEAQDLPPRRAPARSEVRAPIVRVSLRVAESSPREYFAEITSALPNGCTQFARFAVRRDGSRVFVDVFNTAPRGEEIACTMIYGEKESEAPLGSDFTPGATYTLDVNGTTQTFVAQ